MHRNTPTASVDTSTGQHFLEADTCYGYLGVVLPPRVQLPTLAARLTPLRHVPRSSE
eukprot:m.351455 g.351455  ORF g.351455 m.351455 type:complete len:57 (+) comp27977_c1_seq3:3203-3373(+)